MKGVTLQSVGNLATVLSVNTVTNRIVLSRTVHTRVPLHRPVSPGSSVLPPGKTEVVRMRVHHVPRASTQEQVRLPRV